MNLFRSNKELYRDENRGERNWLKFGAMVIAACMLTGVALGLIAHFIFPYGFNTSPVIESIKDEKIKGNKNSRIYHWPQCPNYNDISDRNVIWFKTREEAEAAGYRAARNC